MDKWEDTVMSDIDLLIIYNKIFNKLDRELIIRTIAKAQAEISFKAGEDKGKQEGKQEGIKLVVEFIEKEFGYFTHDGLSKVIIDDVGYYGREGSIAKWQAFLESKGLVD